MGGADSDDGEMLLSPTPRPWASQARSSGGGDPLPDVRALGDALEAPPVVTGLQNAVGNRVTLALAGGGALRVALPFAPSGPLASACLQALHAVLPAEASWALYARWLCTEGATSADADAQWAALAGVVLSWAADPASVLLGEEGRPPPPLHLPRPSGACGMGGAVEERGRLGLRAQSLAAAACD